MVNVRSIRATILAFVLLLSLSQSGCSVFSSIGGWFSQSYDNTVAYFNAYYNAKRLFDEAEAEVLAARATLKTKSGNPIQPASAGSTAKQKFTAVIDKCSNVLSFYPKSGVVDDALFLIGKSYFYQEEFVKAERKFTELLAKNPKRSMALESQLWLLKTLQKLSKFDDAIRVGKDLAPVAEGEGEEDIAGEALMILGDIAVSQKNTDVAIDQYAKAVATASDGSMRAAAAMKVGDLYFSLPDYEKSAMAYADVEKYSPDEFTLYDSQLQTAIAYRLCNKFDQSISVLRRMESDYRFLGYLGTIRYELGLTKEKSGKLDEAIDIYRLVDTTNAKTEAGAKAAYELGRLYQYELGQYADARLAYSHALVGGSTELTQDATKRVAAFESYFRLQTQYFKLDSIYSILDIDSLWIKKDTLAGKTKPDSSLGQSMKEQAVASTRKSRTSASGIRDSAAAPQRDSVLISAKKDSSHASVKSESIRLKADSTLAFARSDTLNVRGDTLRSVRRRDSTFSKLPDPPQYWPKPKKDTLIASLGRLSYLTGELFYAELDVPDSAYYWLSKSLKLGIDSIKTPRALYVLAEVARANPEKKYGNEEDLYLLITEKYPKSTYAEEARIALGFRPTVKEVDPAAGLYSVADSLIYAGEHKKALDSLGRIVGDFGQSPLVAKSRYTMAWIYENYLASPDSALSQYKTLAQKFATTKYGLAAQKRIPPLEPPVKPAADSLKKTLPDSVKSVGSGVPAKALPDSTMQGTKMTIPKIAGDSTEHRNITRPPMPDSLRMRFEPDLIQKRPPVEVDTVKREGKKEK